MNPDTQSRYGLWAAILGLAFAAAVVLLLLFG